MLSLEFGRCFFYLLCSIVRCLMHAMTISSLHFFLLNSFSFVHNTLVRRFFQRCCYIVCTVLLVMLFIVSSYILRALTSASQNAKKFPRFFLVKFTKLLFFFSIDFSCIELYIDFTLCALIA